MPRSPTSTTRVIPNRSLTLVTWLATVMGSPVSPAKTSMATGMPSRGQQAVDDLQPAPHPVLRVADGALRAGPALERGAGHVIQDQGAVGQVPGRRRVLDLLLPGLQPVHRRVQVILITRAQPEDLAQGTGGGLAAQPAGDGQLGVRPGHLRDRHRHHQVPVPGRDPPTGHPAKHRNRPAAHT